VTAIVPIDVAGDTIAEDALGVLSKAATLDAEVAAVLFGAGAGGAVGQAAAHGATRIEVIAGPAFSEPLAPPRVDTLAALVDELAADLILAPTTTISGDVMAALAARLGGGLLWGLADVAREGGDLVAWRPAQNDSVIAEMRWTGTPRLGLFRPYALGPVERPVADPPVTTRDPPPARSPLRIVRLEPIEAGTGPSLSGADIVVSGGRGLGSPDRLDQVRELAGLLGGAPGVSLPLVEMGWAPRAMQVGQTGTVVSPRLYIACGISGQIQHRVGMERSGVIVAINPDKTAPIMGFCDLAVIAEFDAIVPGLIALLRGE